MQKHDHFTLMGVILLSTLSLMPGMPAPNAGDERRCAPAIGQLVSVQGRVEVRSAGEARWQVAALNDTLCGGDTIRALPRSRTILFLPAQQTTLQLDQSTTITLPDTSPSVAPFWIDLLDGAGHFLSRTPRTFKIKTPFVNAYIEGTEFVVRVERDQTLISVLNGTILASNDAGSLRLQSGQAAVATATQAPQPRLVTKPRDAVQWALYYPPIIDYRSAVAESAPAVQAALDLYRQGRLLDVFARLDRVPPPLRDGRYFDIRAGLLLSVGRVEEARADIEQALRLRPGDSTAIALQSLIAVVQNDKEQALRLAKQAVSAEPRSPVSQIALSYAYQARFDIEKAFDSVREATRLAPDNALARARLSELSFSKGELDHALTAAKKATALEPALARTQTVLGFAALTEINLDNAKVAFHKAIALDHADPLPRLGLGLAQIRKGDLDKGTQDIEIAATLDPNNSLVRSYLGKAYYEQKRSGLAGTELQIAKALDPQDPTPWFYDAIRKQTENRPVEALHDIQKSIDLNGNRAVYRSKLLLDQDLAARSAAQGRIYRDLGFEQLALVEGWKSVNTDPGDYSAHRLLADSYSILPRHEIGRVSELLQSQLLQPLNINPLQPQLAEKNLFILEGAGVAAPAFNEFNPLFTRNRLTLQTSGVFGSHDTFGDEVVHSGLWDNISYSVGQFHYQSNGFRPNNDVRNDLVDGFFQASLSPSLSMQAEVRHKEFERGDRSLSADGSFSGSQRREINSDTVRVGTHYAIDHRSDVIASYIHREGDDCSARTCTDTTVPPLFVTYGNSGEAQYLFRGERFGAVAGVGYSSSGFFPSLHPEADSRIAHANGYLYSYLVYPEAFTWTLGLSFDRVSDDFSIKRIGVIEQPNPKFGLIWRATPTTTVRMAAFRAFKRDLLTNQTIEPTQVAGFNQFFDDLTGSDYRRYGIAIDQKFDADLFAGLEFSARELDVPFQKITASWQEKSGRAYVQWTPSINLATSLTYELDQFDGDKRLRTVESDSITHQLQARVRYFNESGLFSSIVVRYINQDVSAPPDFFISAPQRRKNEFFVVDAGLGYRLPKRFGIIGIELRNLFNERFNFQDLEKRAIEPAIPFIPERAILTHFTIAF